MLVNNLTATATCSRSCIFTKVMFVRSLAGWSLKFMIRSGCFRLWMIIYTASPLFSFSFVIDGDFIATNTRAWRHLGLVKTPREVLRNTRCACAESSAALSPVYCSGGIF